MQLGCWAVPIFIYTFFNEKYVRFVINDELDTFELEISKKSYVDFSVNLSDPVSDPDRRL